MTTKDFEIFKHMFQIAKDQGLTTTLMYSYKHAPRTTGMNESYKIILYTNTFSVGYKDNVSEDEGHVITKFLQDNNAVDLKCEVNMNINDAIITLR